MNFASEPEPSEKTAPVADDEVAGATCPVCGTRCDGDDVFCEGCGHDLTATLPAQTWEVEVFADRAYFEQVQADGIEFPSEAAAPRRIVLAGDDVVIGRGGSARGNALNIDLSIPPEDTGVSHVHAKMTRGDDGRWSVVDLGSTNGTFVNESHNEITRGQPVVLNDGDRIHIGAWTTIVVRVIRESA
jgi:hypothetical protein